CAKIDTIIMVFLYYRLDFISYEFFFSSRRRHTRSKRDWSSDVCSSDLYYPAPHFYRYNHRCRGFRQAHCGRLWQVECPHRHEYGDRKSVVQGKSGYVGGWGEKRMNKKE